jgi:hypothetical protein
MVGANYHELKLGISPLLILEIIFKLSRDQDAVGVLQGLLQTGNGQLLNTSVRDRNVP